MAPSSRGQLQVDIATTTGTPTCAPRSWSTASACNQIDEIGIDKVMWSSDYPHNESTFGYSERSLAAVVDAVGPEDAAHIVSGNIRKFLGI